MEQFSKNFSYEELIASATAKRLKLNNTPTPEEKEKLKRLAVEVLQPIRDKWKSPIIINSAYRSEALNKAVGGVPTSQHRLGEAADIRPNKMTEGGKLYRMIQNMVNSGELKVGQCIWEYGNSKNPQWVHVSLPRKNKPNNQFLKIK